MKNTVVLTLSILTLVLSGCHRPSDSEILRQAWSRIEARPDSVVRLLEEEIQPSSLSEEEKAAYWYLLTLGHTMQGRSLINDSLINFSVEYYRKQPNPHRLFNACRFAAWQARSDDRYKVRQEQLWLEALSVAEAENNPDYLSEAYSKLLDFYWEEKQFDQVITYSRKWGLLLAEDRAAAWYYSGLGYAALQQPDSADRYLSDASDLALRDNLPSAFHYLRNYADFLVGHAPENGLLCLNKTRAVFPDHSLNFSFAFTFEALGQMDSAIYYIGKAQIDKKSTRLSEATWEVYMKTIEQIWRAKDGQPYSVNKMPVYCDSISQMTSQRLLNETELLRSQNRLQQATFKAEASRQQVLLILFIFLFIASVMAGFAFFYIRNRRERLLEAEEKLDTLQQLLREATDSKVEETAVRDRPDSAFFRKMLLQQLGIIRLIATVPTQQNRELIQQMSRIANQDAPSDTLLVWEDLYPVIDAVYDHFYSRLSVFSARRLSEKEIQLCCLLCACFSTKEISVVTGQSVRTIYQRKTNIRHALGMDEKDDIVAYINAQS